MTYEHEKQKRMDGYAKEILEGPMYRKEWNCKTRDAISAIISEALEKEAVQFLRDKKRREKQRATEMARLARLRNAERDEMRA